MKKKALLKLHKMLLYDIIRLSEIKLQTRIEEPGLYISAFRSDSNSRERYSEDLKIMKNDIFMLDEKKKYLEGLYSEMELSLRNPQ